LLVAAGATLSCGGGSDGGGIVPAAACIDFTAAAAPVANSVATRRSAGTTCELVQLELVVTDVDEVFGLSFIVGFDPAVASYDGMSTAGSLLASDGAGLEVLEDVGPSQVTLAVSRFALTGVDAQGSQRLLTLRFRKAGQSGSAPLVYVDPKLLVNGTPPQTKTDVTWSAGTLRLR
jgi:hypothetical protein